MPTILKFAVNNFLTMSAFEIKRTEHQSVNDDLINKCFVVHSQQENVQKQAEPTSCTKDDRKREYKGRVRGKLDLLGEYCIVY